jgi:hypothetical protein
LAVMKEIGYDHDLSFETFAQVRANRVDPEYIPVFLKAIAGIGEVFRKELQN